MTVYRIIILRDGRAIESTWARGWDWTLTLVHALITNNGEKPSDIRVEAIF